MSQADLADATARCLNLLPPNDPACSDARFLRDKRLVEEARLTAETAADVWLAVSPLHVAPAEVIHEVLKEISSSKTVSFTARAHRFSLLIAVSGWAAAAAITLLLWPHSVETGPIKTNSVVKKDATPVLRKDQSATAAIEIPSPHEARRKNQIAESQKRLTTLANDHSAIPRVLTLTAPGSEPRSAVEARQRIQSILVDALRSALEAKSGAPSDPAQLVIERGWLPGGLAGTVDGSVVRHRNFPEDSWRELGFLRSENGEYYDPATQTVWSQDPAGRGFFGQKAAPNEDLATFQPAESDPVISSMVRPNLPQGFIIEDPDKGNALVIIDQLAAAPVGAQQIAHWTDGTGKTHTIPVEELLSPKTLPEVAQNETSPPSSAPPSQSLPPIVWADDDPLIEPPMSTPIVIPIPNGITDFELIERTDTPSGPQDRIIIRSDP